MGKRYIVEEVGEKDVVGGVVVFLLLVLPLIIHFCSR
jgi:hypothetical protein